MEKMLKTNQCVEEKWRQRWLEDGENDLRELEVKRWVHKPNVREEWACIKVEQCVYRTLESRSNTSYTVGVGTPHR